MNTNAQTATLTVRTLGCNALHQLRALARADLIFSSHTNLILLSLLQTQESELPVGGTSAHLPGSAEWLAFLDDVARDFTAAVCGGFVPFYADRLLIRFDYSQILRSTWFAW